MGRGPRIAVLLSLVLAVGGCGSGSHPAATTHTTPPRVPVTTTVPAASAAVAGWRAATDALCVRKKQATTALGYVQITDAGIARVGLPKVKRLLDSYLARLVAIQRHFIALQEAIPVPAAVKTQAAEADRTAGQFLGSTDGLRLTLKKVRTTAQLSAAFKTWVSDTQQLVTLGNGFAKSLGLSDCTAS